MKSHVCLALTCTVTLALAQPSPPPSLNAQAQRLPPLQPSATCVYETGAVVDVQFPCDAARVARFSKRLMALYPGVRDINTSPDYIMGLYGFAMAGCTGHFAQMTPEDIGVNGEPFFPKEMLAAMITVGREVNCPAQPPAAPPASPASMPGSEPRG